MMYSVLAGLWFCEGQKCGVCWNISHTHTHTHTHREKKEEEKFVKLNDFLEASPFSLATGSYPPCLPLHPMSPFWPMLAPFWRGGGFPGIEMLSHLSTRFESGLAGPREPWRGSIDSFDHIRQRQRGWKTKTWLLIGSIRLDPHENSVLLPTLRLIG